MIKIHKLDFLDTLLQESTGTQSENKGWRWQPLILNRVFACLKELIAVAQLLQLHFSQELLHDFVLLLEEILELEVILYHLVSPSLKKVQERAALLAVRVRVAVSLLQEVHAVLGSAEAALEGALPNFESIQALESHSHALDGVEPDVDCALSLLLVVVLRLAVDQHPLNLAKLAK
jgi:hypothetical protein